MLQLFQPRPDLRSAHVFADHLEATLDLAEELELLFLIPSDDERAPGRDVLHGLDRVGIFVDRIETIELAIAAKLDLSRAAARRIAEADARLSTFTRLFHAGTQPLVDLWPSLADPGRRIFDTGHDPLTFLQARGVIDASRSTLEGLRFLDTGSEFLLLGTVKLGAFIDLCDTCLKALDRHYHIYEDDTDWEAGRARTLDVLRGQRDEAIRVALGALPAPIEAPVEIVASDALDEAIELIEALTFPEAKRFDRDHPLAEGPGEEATVALEAETITGEPVVALDVAEQAILSLSELIAAADTEVPAELPAEALVEEVPEAVVTDVRAESVESSIINTDAPPAEIPADPAPAAARPGLLAPLSAARRSLAAILARRKQAAEAKSAATTELDLATPRQIAADAIPVEVSPSDVVATSALDFEVEVAGMPAEATGDVADVVTTDAEPSLELKGARQRLVAIIAERAAMDPGAAALDAEAALLGADDPAAPESSSEAEVEPAATVASFPETSVSSDIYRTERPVEPEPVDTASEVAAAGPSAVVEEDVELHATEPLILPPLAEQTEEPAFDAPTAARAKEVAAEPDEMLIPEGRAAEPATVAAADATSADVVADEQALPEPSVAISDGEAYAPAASEPPRRKRRRRVSRRKAAPRKGRIRKG